MNPRENAQQSACKARYIRDEAFSDLGSDVVRSAAIVNEPRTSEVRQACF